MGDTVRAAAADLAAAAADLTAGVTRYGSVYAAYRATGRDLDAAVESAAGRLAYLRAAAADAALGDGPLELVD